VHVARAASARAHRVATSQAGHGHSGSPRRVAHPYAHEVIRAAVRTCCVVVRTDTVLAAARVFVAALGARNWRITRLIVAAVVAWRRGHGHALVHAWHYLPRVLARHAALERVVGGVAVEEAVANGPCAMARMQCKTRHSDGSGECTAVNHNLYAHV
jgi:hypothetical protein